MRAAALARDRTLNGPSQSCVLSKREIHGPADKSAAVFQASGPYGSELPCSSCFSTFLRVFVPPQRCDVLHRQASIFLTDDEEFVLELSRPHWKTFKENVWKNQKDLEVSSLDGAGFPSDTTQQPEL